MRSCRKTLFDQISCPCLFFTLIFSNKPHIRSCFQKIGLKMKLSTPSGIMVHCARNAAPTAASTASSTASAPPPSDSAPLLSSTRLKRRTACGLCANCLVKENCNECIECIHRVTRKKKCIQRKCLHLKPGKSAAEAVAPIPNKRSRRSPRKAPVSAPDSPPTDPAIDSDALCPAIDSPPSPPTTSSKPNSRGECRKESSLS